ncbi:hypothetical protein [Nonomuraea jabiensis]|uniref:hypothetical protein n=1 Tax=Nonomuraea jabiensis TaxID=882448 RepID=UPI0036869F80
MAPQPGLPQGAAGWASIVVRAGWSDARPPGLPGPALRLREPIFGAVRQEGMTSRVLALLALVAGLVVFTGGTASACQCVERAAKDRMEGAAAVFTGTVTRVGASADESSGGHVIAVLRADHVYKGEAREWFQVSTRKEGPACGYDFAAGSRHLVFAGGRDAALTTSSCSGSRQVPAGDGPLRRDDDEGLTRELIAALGAPTRVRQTSAAEPAITEPAAEPAITDSAAESTAQPAAQPAATQPAGPSGGTGVLVAVLAALGVVALAAGGGWAYRRRSST